MSRITLTHITPQRTKWFMLLAMGVILLLCAFPADYATKGEPREALVAVEMLRSSNWVLPIDAAGDMAYKPPLFHWLVALFSLPAGHVTEFSSRLPSVLALWLMCVGLWWFAARSLSRPVSAQRPLLAVLVLFTSFEVFRAGVNCRVDMLLCSLIVWAVLLLFRGGCQLRGGSIMWHLGAVLCMSGAVLTKGPVGAVLPLLIWWVWGILMGWKSDCAAPVWKLTLRALALGVASLLLPAVWYWSAYMQGGDRFLRLAMEENFGRMLGTMSYDSHVKPFWYNFVMLASGLLPWTALLLLSLAWRPWKWMKRPAPTVRSGRKLLPHLSAHELMNWVAVICVLVFYTIPKSKRGVYLLPLYPFAASLIADYVLLYSLRYAKAVRVALWSGGVAGGLYLIIYMVVWPLMVNSSSDRLTAREIKDFVGDAPVYTYINSRMDRFYGVDFYFGRPLLPLLPSGQDADAPSQYTPHMARTPLDSVFFVAVPEWDADKQGVELTKEFNRRGYQFEPAWTSGRKTRDMRQRLILYRAVKDKYLNLND